MLLPAAPFAILLLAQAAIPPGAIADRVQCRAAPGVSYALYLPSTYTADRSWPVLYCLDPGARGRLPVERFAKAAEREGFIVAGSHNARNGPLEPVKKAIDATWIDTHERFRIDDTRVFAAGFSGGSRVALSWAVGGQLAGVVACGAGFGVETPRGIRFALFAAAGRDDFNYHELYRLSLDLARSGNGAPNRFSVFPGGHEWLPEELALEALQFLAGKLPSRPAVDSAQERREEAEFHRWNRILAEGDATARADAFRDLRHRSAKPADTAERRVARRVVGGAFVGAAETARSWMSRKRYGEAAAAWERAVLIRPDDPGPWYALAVASSAAGNKRRALEALEKAAAHGFADWKRAENEPLLERVRGDRRYRQLTGSPSSSPVPD